MKNLKFINLTLVIVTTLSIGLTGCVESEEDSGYENIVIFQHMDYEKCEESVLVFNEYLRSQSPNKIIYLLSISSASSSKYRYVSTSNNLTTS